MSEKPTLPISDEKTSPVAYSAEQMLQSHEQNAAFWRAAEYQLAPQPERWDLDEPIVAFDPDRAVLTEGQSVTPPEYAAPKTYEQSLEESLMYLNDRELLAYATSNTKAVIAMRRIV